MAVAFRASEYYSCLAPQYMAGEPIMRMHAKNRDASRRTHGGYGFLEPLLHLVKPFLGLLAGTLSMMRQRENQPVVHVCVPGGICFHGFLGEMDCFFKVAGTIMNLRQGMQVPGIPVHAHGMFGKCQ